MGSYRALSPPGTSYLVLALSADDAESKLSKLLIGSALAEAECASPPYGISPTGDRQLLKQ